MAWPWEVECSNIRCGLLTYSFQKSNYTLLTCHTQDQGWGNDSRDTEHNIQNKDFDFHGQKRMRVGKRLERTKETKS